MDYRTAHDELPSAVDFSLSGSVPRAPAGRKVLQAAEARLRASSHAALRTLVCEFRAGVLVLRGEVATHYLRQLAQETVRSLAGVNEIVNLVEVISHRAS